VQLKDRPPGFTLRADTQSAGYYISGTLRPPEQTCFSASRQNINRKIKLHPPRPLEGERNAIAFRGKVRCPSVSPSMVWGAANFGRASAKINSKTQAGVCLSPPGEIRIGHFASVGIGELDRDPVNSNHQGADLPPKIFSFGGWRRIGICFSRWGHDRAGRTPFNKLQRRG
jgi:hypothetical protein